MATFTLRRFSRPAILRQIEPTRLLAFLEQFRRYFLQRDVHIPKSVEEGDIDYDAVASVFLTPATNTPTELADAIFYVDEMATQEGMDLLLEEAAKRNLHIDGDELSPADVAVQIWALDKDLLERKHGEIHLRKIRSFESFQMCGKPPKSFAMPSEKKIAALAAEMDTAFVKKKCGRGTRILASEHEDCIEFLVRHGVAFKREESIDSSATTFSLYYRPVKDDVVRYVRTTGELQINARSKWEKQLYRSMFGKHFFGSEDAFPGTNKYTLDPLRKLGSASVNIGIVAGIEWIKLLVIQRYIKGDKSEVVAHEADDYFELLEYRKEPFPSGRLLMAKFNVKFTDNKTPRSVVIRPGNIAQYTRDSDSAAIEEWLKLRGFILDPMEADDDLIEAENAEEALARR